MGITSTLYDGYTEKGIETAEFETPFGDVSVYVLNQKIKFNYTTKKYIFENGLSADIHRIEINTLEYNLNDEFDVRVGNVNKFEYYASDEYTTMLEYHNNKYCIAVIGYDSEYDFETDEFFGGYEFTFGTSGTDYGVNYTIVRNPEEIHEQYKNTIYTWIIFLPVSDDYDAAELINIELV